MSDYSRDRQLDMLRGIAVMGMFFYSVVATFSQKLPPLLEHNIPGKLRLGDFVLSLFLFSSGMSLAILRSRYDTPWRTPLWRSIARRLSVMLVASTFITPFSSGTIGGMDEVMLNATLTIPTLLIASSGINNVALLFACLSLLYYALPSLGVTVVSPETYLGGYRGAIFFLPVLGAGALLSHSWRNRALRHAAAWGVVAIILCVIFGAPDKLRLTPSFMALSCSMSALTLYVLGRFSITNNCIEHCGRYSLRMWCLMFVLLAPARLYAETILHTHQIPREAWEAVLIALTWMGICYGLSLGWDTAGALEKAHRARRRSH